MKDPNKQLRDWIDEDKSICKADKYYTLNYIKENYIPKDKVRGLRIVKNNWIKDYEEKDVSSLKDSAVYYLIDEFNDSIDELLK